MAIMEISIVPVGTGSPSVSRYVAEVIKEIPEEKDVTYKLTPMGTVIQSESIEKLFEIAKRMHESVFEKHIDRVVTDIRVDDRRDKSITMESKLDSVNSKIGTGDGV